MDHRYFEARGARNAAMHAAVAEVERTLALVPESPTRAELRASVAALIQALALEPLADLSPCPTCGRAGMRAATRCSHCWRTLVPPGAPEPSEPRITRGED
jgi:hypothetical protein